MFNILAPDSQVSLYKTMKYKSNLVISKPLVDSYRHKGLRQNLVTVLRRKGIRDEKVLHAISIIPRHFMLDAAFADWAVRPIQCVIPSSHNDAII